MQKIFSEKTLAKEKITPIEANRVFSPAVPDQRVGEDTSIGVTVSSRTEAHEQSSSSLEVTGDYLLRNITPVDFTGFQSHGTPSKDGSDLTGVTTNR